MEKRIVKSGVYGFLIGLLIGIVFLKDTEVIRHVGSFKETAELPLRMYLFKLLRFSSIFSLVSMVLVWISGHFVITNEKTKFVVLLKSYFKALILGLLIILMAVFIQSLLYRN